MQVSSVGLLPELRSSVTPYDFVTVFLPNKTQLIAELSKERLARLERTKVLVVKANATVLQTFSGKPFISALQLPGEATMQVEKGDSGLYLSLAYLFAGLLAMVWAISPAQADLGLLSAVLPAALLVASGYALANFKLPSLTADASTRFLGFIPMGSGKTGVAAMSLLALTLSVVSFYYGGLLYLLGLNTTVALGMMLALLFKPYATR